MNVDFNAKATDIEVATPEAGGVTAQTQTVCGPRLGE